MVLMLSDRDIRLAMTPEKQAPNLRHRDPLVIVPEPSDDCIQPASVDLRLGNEFIYWVGQKGADIVKRQVTKDHFVLRQGQFILATTLEYVEIPNWLCGILEGKSSLGRQGVMVHVTAGLIDPGFKGMITLEIKNVGYENVRLDFGMKISQLTLVQLSSPALRPYGSEGLGSRYQGQVGVTDAR